MVYDQRSPLSSYLANLQSQGQIAFSGRDAEQALGVERGAFLDAAERLQRRHHLLNPRQDFYVTVPPQFASWGGPPPSWYIDSLMRHEGEAYYVGLLKAAELHGATHQAVMEFQVITGKRLPRIRAGRNFIVFYYRKDMKAAASGIEEHQTDTGTMQVSSAALTALDLLRYPQAAGGVDNLATVLRDMGTQIEAARLAELAKAAERPVVQRLGYLLDLLGHGDRAAPMHAVLEARGPVSWTELDRKEARDPDFARPPQEHNARWRVIMRRAPELDE